MTIKSWTDYFLDMAKTCSSRSNCLRAQVGAIIVGQDKKIKATGYNGAPSGVESCYEKAKQCILENMELLNTIADYLLKVETLTKSDIEEITNTGKLSWYEEKLEQEQQFEMVTDEIQEVSNDTENTESQETVEDVESEDENR